MKRLTKLHTILIIILILVLAGSVFIFFSYREAESKLPEIQKEINLAMMQLTVAREKTDLDTLKQELRELEFKINQAGEPPFPRVVPSIEIGDLIVDSVNKLDLELLKLSSDSEAGTKTIESNEDAESTKYNKAEYEVEVRGYLSRINSLLAEIEGAKFATLTIEDLELELEEDEETTVELWKAEFTIVTLYLYEEETD